MSRIQSVFLLAAFALTTSGCGDSRYRLDGRVDFAGKAIPPQIALLDSTATHKVLNIHELYSTSADSLAQAFTDTLALLDKETAEAQGPIAEAERRLRARRSEYVSAFNGMEKFTSFGGNKIFGKTDQKVPTDKLLEEISDRFYKGKAFSLEVGSKIRTTIRQKLIPAEKRVNLAIGAVWRLKSTQQQRKARRQEVAAKEAIARGALVDQFNRRMIDRIEGGVLREAELDSSSSYAFGDLREGRYHLYLRSMPPRLVEIVVDVHKHILIQDDATTPLISTPVPSES